MSNNKKCLSRYVKFFRGCLLTNKINLANEIDIILPLCKKQQNNKRETTSIILGYRQIHI